MTKNRFFVESQGVNSQLWMIKDRIYDEIVMRNQDRETCLSYALDLNKKCSKNFWIRFMGRLKIIGNDNKEDVYAVYDIPNKKWIMESINLDACIKFVDNSTEKKKRFVVRKIERCYNVNTYYTISTVFDRENEIDCFENVKEKHCQHYLTYSQS